MHGIVKIFNGFTDHCSSLISNNPLLSSNSHRGNSRRQGGGGGGGERNHNVLSQIFCPPAIAKEDKSQDWDSHDLQANLVVQLNKLSRLNKSNLQNPENPPFPLHGIVKIFKGFTHHFSSLISNIPLFSGNSHRGNSHRGGGGGGGGRERNHNVGSQIFCPSAIAKEDKAQDWDSHGLQANLVVHLNKLSRLKRYKVSNIKFLNPRTRSVVNGADEAFGDLVELQPGGVYTRYELMEKLENLSSSGLFEKIEFDAKTNPDGSVDINIPFKENTYPLKTRFKCISVDSLPEFKPIEMDKNMTENEMFEYERRMNKQNRERIESAKECILPEEVQKEIQSMLLQRATLSASLLRRIARKIDKWYHDNAYNGFHIVETRSLDSNPGGEIIFEVVEGEIKKLAVRFEDKLGNTCEGNTNIGVIKRALPEEVTPNFNFGAFFFFFFRLIICILVEGCSFVGPNPLLFIIV